MSTNNYIKMAAYRSQKMIILTIDTKQYQSSMLSLLIIAIATLLMATTVCVGASQLSVGIEHDLSKPTFGLQGPSSSALTYDEKNGLNLRGTINDLLGPPIKMANGFSNMLAGSNMAGIGSSLKSDGAVLGFDAKLLEAAGGANILKGGLLLGTGGAFKAAATAADGLEGKKIGSIIEVPVKVVAMKDIGVGKGLAGMGKLKEAEALQAKTRGANMIKQGDALKAQGLNQVVQGASEGMQNIGSIVQQTAGNAATAFRLLPIILDLPTGGATTEQPQQHLEQQQQHLQQQQQESFKLGLGLGQHHQPSSLTGGSMFGGLNSLLPGLAGPSGGATTGAQGDPLLAALTSGLNALGGGGGVGAGQQQNKQPFNLFGAPPGQQHGAPNYAALLNATNPLTSLLMNPGLNPFLLPISGGPLGQSLQSKLPTAPAPAGFGQSGQQQQHPATHNYNLFPGIKVRESTSSHPPSSPMGQKQPEQQQQQHQEKTTEQQLQQQQQQTTKV